MEDTSPFNANSSTSVDSQTEPYFYKKYTYHFDYPGIEEAGYVEITPKTIKILFPEKKEKVQSVQCKKNVLVFIDTQLRFSLEWLPIYSFDDFCKAKDMLTVCLYEYNYMYNYPNYLVNLLCANVSQYYNGTMTEYSDNLFKIQCYDDCYNTNIEIFSKCKFKQTYNTTFDVQFFIGGNKIFSTQNLPIASYLLYDILHVILHKISHL